LGTKIKKNGELRELKELKGVKGHYFSLFTLLFSLLFRTFALGNTEIWKFT
jgi:ABC-type branched-subunit amino acid transport system permease subunit